MHRAQNPPRTESLLRRKILSGNCTYIGVPSFSNNPSNLRREIAERSKTKKTKRCNRGREFAIACALQLKRRSDSRLCTFFSPKKKFDNNSKKIRKKFEKNSKVLQTRAEALARRSAVLALKVHCDSIGGLRKFEDVFEIGIALLCIASESLLRSEIMSGNCIVTDIGVFFVFE